jgi:hypothetical protein
MVFSSSNSRQRRPFRRRICTAWFMGITIDLSTGIFAAMATFREKMNFPDTIFKHFDAFGFLLGWLQDRPLFAIAASAYLLVM